MNKLTTTDEIPETYQPYYYDQHNAPTGENAYRKAIKRGEFKAYRVGKKLLARADDVHAFIERNPVKPAKPEQKPTPQPELDEVDALLAAGGVTRRG